MPAFGAWFSSSGGTSLPRLSRPLSVNQSSRVLGIPVEADAVPDAAREHLAPPATGGVQAADRAVLALRLAHVARRADADVEQPSGPKRSTSSRDGDRAAGPRPRHGLRRALEARLDVVVAQDARDLADIQRAAAERDAVRRLEIARHRDRAPSARRYRIHRAGVRPDEKRAALAERERARLLQPTRHRR